MNSRVKFIVGIDEAGRGALAGPVAVGAVLVPKGFDFSVLGDVRDSKQLSPQKREEVFKKARALSRAGVIRYAVALIGARTIDRIGITGAITQGVARSLAQLEAPHTDTFVLLDGLLRAPAQFSMQRTVTKGDQLHKEISLASIMAKVTRDRHMVRLATSYPAYGFEIHKGYGTLSHRHAIRTYDRSREHRALFCRKLDA